MSARTLPPLPRMTGKEKWEWVTLYFSDRPWEKMPANDDIAGLREVATKLCERGQNIFRRGDSVKELDIGSAQMCAAPLLAYFRGFIGACELVRFRLELHAVQVPSDYLTRRCIEELLIWRRIFNKRIAGLTDEQHPEQLGQLGIINRAEDALWLSDPEDRVGKAAEEGCEDDDSDSSDHEGDSCYSIHWMQTPDPASSLLNEVRLDVETASLVLTRMGNLDTDTYAGATLAQDIRQMASDVRFAGQRVMDNFPEGCSPAGVGTLTEELSKLEGNVDKAFKGLSERLAGRMDVDGSGSISYPFFDSGVDWRSVVPGSDRNSIRQAVDNTISKFRSLDLPGSSVVTSTPSV